MSLTSEEIADKLMQFDEVTLLEILNISSEELVERFTDKIEDRRSYFEEDLES
jgi:hypothetical protein